LKKWSDIFMMNFRTDLALERRDLYRKANNVANEVNGLETEEEQLGETIKITRVKVLNQEGEQAIGKKQGNYITIDIKDLKIAEEEDIQKASEAVTKELRTLIGNLIQPQEDILVVGLGNLYVTPDALGPKVIQDIDITRHLLNYMPEVLEQGTRPVSAVSPGVLGTTGIETVEILKGIVDNVHPKLIIVIDALASRSIERISSTVQIADTGIVPGAGVGNQRKELTVDTLGIPVIAIGVPTVVEAATIAADSLNLFIQRLQEEAHSNEFLNQLQEEDKYQMIKEVLQPADYNFIVTPKEIDDLIENMSSVVARGINFATQK
jgi:spore protease